MISIVTPTTRERRKFLPAASRCLAAQGLTDIEWLIFQEFEGKNEAIPVPNLAFPATFHFMKSGKMSTGVKRNHVNNQAKGDIIVHWDDDDWYAPSRLADQLDFFRASGKAVTGYHSILYWDHVADRGFKYTDPLFRPHAAGASLVYTREFWKRYKFDDRAVAEDFLFCMWARNTQQLSSKDGEGFMVAQLHGANTAQTASRAGTSKFPLVPKENFPAAFLLTLGESSA